MATTTVLESLPTARPRGRPFDPPDELTALREREPLVRLRYPDGHLGWLATGYDEVRAVLADRRFSSRYELLHLPMPGIDLGGLDAVPPAPLGDLTGIDPPEHGRYRKPLVAFFTARRIAGLAAQAERVTHELLDAMAAHDGPVDLVAGLAAPLPARMICALLGVPAAEHDRLAADFATITDLHAPFDDKVAAHAVAQERLDALVRAKRDAPGDDVLSALTGSDLTDAELAAIGLFLLAAGLDTTKNMIALGAFALLEHPEALAALRTEPVAAAGPAVEELMRYLTIAHTNVRAALVDVEVAGRTVAAGETVTVALGAANRDPRRFGDPDRLDLHRRAVGHLGFGHGIHQCLGQQLARVEMRAALPALVTRFPELRLGVAADEVPVLPDAALYGAARLPVLCSTAGSASQSRTAHSGDTGPVPAPRG